MSSVQKIELVTPSSAFVYAGLGPDYRVLLRKARKSAMAYKHTYGEEMPLGMAVKATAAVMQEYTQSGGVRPFGVSLLAAGYDDVDGPGLFQIDPSGANFGWRATAIGKGFTNAKSFLEKRYSPDMELEDAIHTALLTLREGFEGEMTAHNIQLAVIGADRKFRLLTPAEVADYLAEAD